MAKNIVEKVEKAIGWIDLSANEVSIITVISPVQSPSY